MHPLSVFPQLLFLGLIAPLLLRVAVGVFMLFSGWERYKKTQNQSFVPHFTSGLLVISGVLVLLGLYTQIGVILGIIALIFDKYVETRSGQLSRDKKILYIIVAIILLSLLFTGPGFLAFDLPL